MIQYNKKFLLTQDCRQIFMIKYIKFESHSYFIDQVYCKVFIMHDTIHDMYF